MICSIFLSIRKLRKHCQNNAKIFIFFPAMWHPASNCLKKLLNKYSFLLHFLEPKQHSIFFYKKLVTYLPKGLIGRCWGRVENGLQIFHTLVVTEHNRTFKIFQNWTLDPDPNWPKFRMWIRIQFWCTLFVISFYLLRSNFF